MELQPDIYSSAGYRISKCLGYVQPYNLMGFGLPFVVSFNPISTFGNVSRRNIECDATLLPDAVIDHPNFIPSLRQVRDFALTAHPGLILRYEGNGARLTHGIGSTLVFEGDLEFNELRISRIRHEADETCTELKTQEFVNVRHIPAISKAMQDEVDTQVKKLRLSVRQEKGQLALVESQIGDAETRLAALEQEVKERLGRLEEMDLSLEEPYETIDLKDVAPQPLVYFIRDASHTGYIKIGKANLLHSRFPDFGTTKMPINFQLQIIHVIYHTNPGVLERQLHERFADKRRHGEWFALSGADIQAIKSEYANRQQQAQGD